jgi:hypothetical protein
MNILYKNFKGLAPRYDSHLLGDGFATTAKDVNLWHGTLRPFREKKLCREIKKTTKSVFYDNCCWKEFDKCVEFTRLNTSCARQVVTGLFDYPATSCSDECNPRWIRLGLPSPGTAPSVERLDPLEGKKSCYSPNLIDSIEYKRATRTYVYTYVNSCCDEGPPSYPTETLDVDDGGRVMLSGFNTPSAEYDVKSIRIYRLASGFDINNTSIENFNIDETNALSDYYLVDEIPVGTAAYIDDKLDYELGYAMETQEYVAPPKDLRGVISVDGTQLAGITGGNKIRFSTPNFPHAWQEADELTVPDQIQALVEFKSDIIVLTCGALYKVEPIEDCKTVGCRKVTKTLEDYPLISCCGGNGYALTPKGVVFASIDGLILTDGVQATNITSPYFARDDWQALHPDRMSVAYNRDSVYFFSDVAGYCLQFPVSLTEWENSHLIELSDRPEYAFGENDELYLVEKGAVYRWDRGDTYRPYHWVSRKEISPTQINFAGAKVSRYNNGDVTFKFIGDDILIKEYSPLQTEKFRLPSGRRDIEFQVDLKGTAEVYQVEISTSYIELGTV